MKILPVDHPVIQAPMQGVTSPEMVAAVAEAGGLGSLPLGGLSPERSLELIRKTKALTDKPFAVNLFAHKIPTIDKRVAEIMSRYLSRVGERYQLPFMPLQPEELRFHSCEELTGIILSENIKIVSFTFGVLNDDMIRQLKKKQVILMGTATCPEEARLLDEKGIDIIIAQGIEAGGHRGTFLDDISLPQIRLASLVSQIVKITFRPVVAAGGLADKASIRAAMLSGAKGIQAGTAFILSDESLAAPAYKTELEHSGEYSTSLTRCFSGRWARSIRNRFMGEVERSGLTIPEYPIQNMLTTPLRTAAGQMDNKDFLSLYAGSSSHKACRGTAAEICRQLIRDFNGG